VKEEDPRGKKVLSGRDLRAGGTWLGMNRGGRVALITNITEEPQHYDSTRGYLVSSFLLPEEPETSLQDHVDVIVREDIPYAGFNLLLLAPSSNPSVTGASGREHDSKPGLSYHAAYVTNSGGGGSINVRHLRTEERLCGGMSNGVDGHGADRWPKVKRGTELFDEALEKSRSTKTTDEELTERLFEVLSWQGDTGSTPPHQRSELPRSIHISPLYIPSPEGEQPHKDFYGTRISTVILVHRDGRVLFAERDIWSLDEENKQPIKADRQSQRVFQFQVLN